MKGRPALSVEAWRHRVVELVARDHGACRVPWCGRSAHDPHHLVKRSAGGTDALRNLVLLCRAHHDWTDASYQAGRLVITRDAACPGGLRFDVITKASRWA